MNNMTKKTSGNNQSQNVGKNHGFRRGRNNKRNPNNLNRNEGGQRRFQKFVDPYHMNNASNNWDQNNWNCDNRSNNYTSNKNLPTSTGAGIFPWIRKNPVNPLIIPQHTNFELQFENEQAESIDKNMILQMQSNTAESSKESETSKEKSISGVENDQDLKLKSIVDSKANIKQEKNSSSSSSSSESSSSEDENVTKSKPKNMKEEITPGSNTSSPVKKIHNQENKFNIKQERNSSSSSSSSESSSNDVPDPNPTINIKTDITPSSKPPSLPFNDDETRPQPQVKLASNNLHKKEFKVQNKVSKIIPKKNKSSDDDVVCMGKLYNKIVLEDGSDNNSNDDNTDESYKEKAEKKLNKISKKSEKQTTEKCMICDEKGHTSFQCQMICKNCSAPYHGYRTCPQPANLNTMLQLFMEFCMHQLENFKPDKQISTKTCDVNKTNKLKHKQLEINESNTKIKSSKKRKVSATKRKTHAHSDVSTDDDNDKDDAESETSSIESGEHILDSSESLVSSKKKRKMKSKKASKAALDLSKFSTNPINLPMILNSFPQLAVQSTSLQNPNTSTNALNTLLLTQMFQNAITSFKK